MSWRDRAVKSGSRVSDWKSRAIPINNEQSRGILGDIEQGLLTNEPTQGFIQGASRAALPLIGGMIAGTATLPTGPGAIGGAALGTGTGESVRQALVSARGAYTGQNDNTAEDILKGVGVQSAFGAIGNAAGQGLAAGVRALKPGATKLGSQAIRVMTGVPEREAAAVLRDPGILSRAVPMEKASAEYAKSIGGLKSGAEASRGSLGKSYFSGEAVADKFDELAGQIADKTINTQTALALRQSTMQSMSDLPFKQRGLSRVLSNNIDKLDEILELRLPKWSGARTGYRESKIAEEFSSWLPLNKNLSPNVLRTTAGIAAAGKGLIEGRPFLAAALPAISPRVWGYGIRAGAALTNAIPSETIRTGAASMIGSYFQEAYENQKNKTPIKLAGK